MGRRIVSLSLGAALVAGPHHVDAADKVLTLEPSSKWNSHYADDFCRLSRSFGEGREQVSLILDRFRPGDNFRLILAGNPMGGTAAQDIATIRFGAVLSEQRLEFFKGDLGKDIPAWVFGQTARIRPYPVIPKGETSVADAPVSVEEEASVTTIRIGKPLRRAIVLNTGSMKAAFAALRKCNEELVAHWGVDVEKHRNLTRWATPLDSPGNWFRPEDYPRSMLNSWQPGLVQFRLTVGADGAPSACHIQQSTHPEGFDAAVCKALMKRARFEPALDAEGQPLPSYYLNLVRFQIRNMGFTAY